jgi:hypothetical protein
MNDDKPRHTERLKDLLGKEKPTGPTSKKQSEGEEGEASCLAFGYLRGIKDHAGAVEFRFRDGNSTWFPYSWLGPWKYNPSEGLLLKFSGDMIYLVLIRGSNLDMPLELGTINLTTGGLQRQRIMWIREMSEADIKSVGETGPTIDSIQVGEFESQTDLKAWLAKNAPAFVR